MVGRRLPRLALFAALLTACGTPPPSDVPTSPAGPIEPRVVCGGVPAATCRDIVDSVGVNAAGAVPVAITISCVTLPCDEANGEVTIDVSFSDGSRESRGQGWTSGGEGVPGPIGEAPPSAELPVEPICLGIDRENCDEMARAAVDGVDRPAAIQSITVRCTSTCTPTRGEGTTHLRLDDGSTTESRFGYESAEAS